MPIKKKKKTKVKKKVSRKVKKKTKVKKKVFRKIKTKNAKSIPESIIKTKAEWIDSS